jgi:hypothetical protein
LEAAGLLEPRVKPAPSPRAPKEEPVRAGPDRQTELAAIRAFVTERGVIHAPLAYVAPVQAALPLTEERARVTVFRPQRRRLSKVERTVKALRRIGLFTAASLLWERHLGGAG